MRNLTLRNRRRLWRAIQTAGAIAFVVAVYLAYRWAGPLSPWSPPAHSGGGSSVTIRLLDTPFAAFIDGARAWSIHAGQVDIMRMPNASLTSVQSATILNIKNGTLYDPPVHPVTMRNPVSTRVMEAGAPENNSGPVGATFHAKQGRYSAGMLEAIPADLGMLFTVQWQFRLEGDVVFQTRSHDVLTAPSMTIYNLVSRKTGRPEQRVMCDKGGRMIHKGIELTANTIRYNPKERTVDCFSGVRSTFKDGSVQAERVYWSLDEEVLRCPDTATGQIKGLPFRAEEITLDIKHQVHHARHIHIDVNSNSIDSLRE